MSFPLQITFRHMLASPIFENRIREFSRRLEKFSSKITNCHVVVERPHHSATQGDPFDVHITLSLPGSTIVVRRSHSTDPKHADAYVALRDAFTTTKRRLQEYERMQRGEVKTHVAVAAQDASAA